ncbi:MAG: hypothetical protein F6K04_27865 [Leptolyngbya sp. SIO4C5]|uniref:hypothetical protein n=1 Tax=Sphaerothrix gracilis TaxID=3151835 RepID=UPI0013BFA15A|nr:hypothetical protein [Leptolyngbya sp. SIO4C5]
MKRLTLSLLSALFATAAVAPAVKAEIDESNTQPVNLETYDDESRGGTQDFEQNGRFPDTNLDESNTQPVNLETYNDESRGGSEMAGVVNPFELTYIAYSGGLRQYGVPAALTLISEYQLGDVTAEQVVEAAIRDRLVDASVMEDERYIDRVDYYLQVLEQGEIEG